MDHPGRRASLRVRITAGALVMVVTALCSIGVVVVRTVEHEMTAQIDAALRADADFTQRLLRSGSGLPTGEGPTDLYVQFVDAAGRVVGAGTAATGRPALAGPGSPPDVIEAGHDAQLGELRVLTAPVRGPGDMTLVLARSSANVADVRSLLVRVLALLVGVGTVLLGVLVWVVVGRALRPVEEMRRVVDRIGDGDLHERVRAPGTRDELDGLAVTLNDLLARLEAAVTRERQFVADASHELRTPVAGIRALLETEPGDPAAVLRTRAEALARLGELQDLVDDLLVLAKEDAGTERPRAPVDLDELVIGQARQLSRSTTLAVDTSRVSGGQTLGRDTDLARLVENLAANAARHARHAVAFSVRQRGDSIELTVADDGPGIPVGDRNRVFERFTMLDDVRTSGRSGAGLGLAIAAAIASAHGGSVSVDDAPGGGARFVVVLPAYRGAPSSVAPAPVP
jgi:signal transduction histidine kinase